MQKFIILAVNQLEQSRDTMSVLIIKTTILCENVLDLQLYTISLLCKLFFLAKCFVVTFILFCYIICSYILLRRQIVHMIQKKCVENISGFLQMLFQKSLKSNRIYNLKCCTVRKKQLMRIICGFFVENKFFYSILTKQIFRSLKTRTHFTIVVAGCE